MGYVLVCSYLQKLVMKLKKQKVLDGSDGVVKKINNINKTLKTSTHGLESN